MAIYKNFRISNIRELIEDYGEQRVREILDKFSCPLNPGVENFFRKNAIEFTKKSQSVTYFVDLINGTFPVGLFALTIKPLTIGINDIKSNTQRKKIERICKLDEKTQSYTMAAYLIAQLGKNFYHGFNEKISGDELLDAALYIIKNLQYQAGGMIVFVETEAEKNLIDFYNRNYFSLLEEINNLKNTDLIQFFRLL